MTKRFPRIDAEGQLKNTLLFAMHPEICVLSMQVPAGLLDAYEQARISQVLMRVRHEGREYCLSLIHIYPRERAYRAWYLNQKPEQPLLECYQELAQRFPEGLAGLPQLAEELSGAVAAPRSVRA